MHGQAVAGQALGGFADVTIVEAVSVAMQPFVGDVAMPGAATEISAAAGAPTRWGFLGDGQTA